MGRMINTDAAYAVLTDYYHHSTDTQHQALKEALGRVESVDAVPVVRCKDCKWCNMGECEHKLGLISANDENYCSLGERKDGDHYG